MKKDILYPIRRLHGKMYEANLERKVVKKLQKKILEADNNAILLVLTPTHGNMGDHAITSAEIEMLNERGINYIEITDREITLLKKYKKLSVMNYYPILVHGGGYIGTLWPEAENMFRAIIVANPASPILCLPNTAFFDSSEEGKLELEISKRIYNEHSALTICAREQFSYEFMKNIYENVVLIPDMVLALNKCYNKQIRSGCLLCLREDREKTRTAEEENSIRKQMHHIFGENVSDSDMNIGRSVPVENRDVELESKYNEFRHSELVVTDRLHGMIFSAITGTPCIVLNSKSPKVRGCYEWISHLEYIQFAERADRITELYEKIPKQTFHYDNRHLQRYYDELKNYISTLVK